MFLVDGSSSLNTLYVTVIISCEVESMFKEIDAGQPAKKEAETWREGCSELFNGF